MVDQGGTLDLSITCEERRGERGERGEERRGERGEEGGG